MTKEIDNQTLYEIFRACRLCGAGGGYKMPIIQTVDGFDCPDVELRQKIKECVQIEVSQEDKMPPLICELCVDKVNDFYEFLDMCRQTNKRTRQRLGLPPQTNIGVSDAGDCILGVTEPVFIQEDEDEPLSRQVKPKNRRKEQPQKLVHRKKERGLTKELESLLKMDTSLTIRESRSSHKESRSSSTSSRSSRSGQPSTKSSAGDDHLSLSKLRALEKKSEKPPRSILKKEKDMKQEDRNNVDAPSLLASRPKRPRTEVKTETPPKKVKIITTPPPGPKSSKSKQRPPSPSPGLACQGCGQEVRTIQGLMSHQRGCHASSTSQNHLEPPSAPSPIPAREPLAAPRATVAGKCSKCDRSYQMAKNLRRHESICKGKKRAEEVRIDPKIRSRLRLAQVRVARCDSLLKTRRGPYYVGGVDRDFGLDPSCVYPFSSYPIRVKSEPLDIDGMVSIKQEIKDEIYTEEDYVHWDSDLSSDSDEDIDIAAPKTKKVDSLTSLALKTIFSKRCLGKVPRKLRKIRTEKFDLFNEFDNITDNINSIIDNLGNDDGVGNGTIGNDNDSAHLSVNENSDAVEYDSDSLLNVQGKSVKTVCDPQSSLSDKSNHKNSNNDNPNDIQNDEITSLNDNGGSVTDASTEDEVGNNLGTEESEVSTTYNTVKHKTVEPDSDSIEDKIDNNDNDSVILDIALSAKDSNDNNDSQDENNDVRNDDYTASENDSQNNDSENNTVSEKDENDSQNTNNTEKVNGGKSELINEIDDLIYDDDDDRRLMAAIDDQIGENGTAVSPPKRKDMVDKITLEDLISKPNAMELDNVSDTEFNFDA